MIHYYSSALGIACGTAAGAHTTNDPFHVNCPRCLTQLTAFGLMPKKEEPVMDPEVRAKLNLIYRLLERAGSPEAAPEGPTRDAYALGWAGSCITQAELELAALDRLLSRTK